jgi:hypothetical protein
LSYKMGRACAVHSGRWAPERAQGEAGHARVCNWVLTTPCGPFTG